MEIWSKWKKEKGFKYGWERVREIRKAGMKRAIAMNPKDKGLTFKEKKRKVNLSD